MTKENEDYARALKELADLGRFGMRLGLETTERLLGRLGDPHLAVPALHVAGSNGKGSTAHALHSILRAAGLKVGLYTSPHLLRFTERMLIGGHEIPRADVVRLWEKVRGAAEGLPITFFEATTAMAFTWFAENRVDAAVVEVGLGGRLDATNVLHPLVSIITSIGLEHREHLGHTLHEIAREKAGIIKGGRPVVLGALHPDAEKVAMACAAERGAPVHRLGHEFEALREDRSPQGERFYYRGQSFGGRLTFPLYGAHQVANAAVAAHAAELVAGFGLPLREKHVTEGLAITRVPGRFAQIGGEPVHVLDIAHNPPAAERLAASLHDRFGDVRCAFVFGVLDDKDHLDMLRALAPRIGSVCAVRPHSGRARDPHDVVLTARELGLNAAVCPTIDEALARAAGEAGEDGVVVVTGSSYTVSAAMYALGVGGERDPIELSDAIRPIV